MTPTSAELAELLANANPEDESISHAKFGDATHQLKALAPALAAEVVRLREALKHITTMQDDEQAWWARDVANTALAAPQLGTEGQSDE